MRRAGLSASAELLVDVWRGFSATTASLL